MPEGDTVHLTCVRLHRALAGREVTRFELRIPSLALADLTGSTVTGVVPRGKHILMRFSTGQTLHSHLRMDGSWRVSRPGERPRGRGFEIRALVGTREAVAAGFRVHDLTLLPTTAEFEVMGHLGPDLLDPAVDLDEALRRLATQPDRAIGEALLDQRLAAGLGNVYKSELLFLHHVHPLAPVASVSDLADLLRDAIRLLNANIGRYERSTTGWRQPGQHYWVYGRSAKACRVCGATIVRFEQGAAPDERLTFYCPRCQPPPDAG